MRGHARSDAPPDRRGAALNWALDLARVSAKLGLVVAQELARPALDRLFGAEDDWGYQSTTTLDDGGARSHPRTSPWDGGPGEAPSAKYRFIREVGNKVTQGGMGLGHEVVALEVRVPLTLVRDSTMPEETRGALQVALGELYDQARDTLRNRAY